VRFYFLFLASVVSFLFLATPAWAGKLLSWSFDSNENRLLFNTNDRVQPKAVLINDPTRIIIDLPGIQLGQPPVNRSIGREIKSVRVGQFDDNTTRLVIEFAPGYTVDPTQVKVKGITATQWTVTLPQFQQVDPTNSTPPGLSSSRPPSLPNNPYNPSGNSDLQVNRNGIFINLKRNGSRDGIIVQHSDDRASRGAEGNRKTIDVQLTGAVLPVSLTDQNFTLNQAGISRIGFRQEAEGARITLSVDPDSPEWVVAYSALGGVLLFPKGGFNNTSSLNNPHSYGNTQINNNYNTGLATISTVELTTNNTLLIRSDRPIHGEMKWNNTIGAYKRYIPHAQLANFPAGAGLDANRTIYELRLRQEANQSVTVVVKLILGAKVEGLNQPRPELLSLDIKPLRVAQSSLPLTKNNDFVRLSLNKRPINRTSPLIIIDPGHGGKDAGAIGLRNIEEKDIVLSISEQVAKFLEEKGLRVMITRNSDFFVSLQGRTDMANEANADLFVSIHANSIGPDRPEINGLEVYYRNNSSLANTIYQSITQTMTIRQRGVRYANFYVLRNSKMPSTLVEVGYVTGDEDSVKLTDPVYQTEMAKAIARGVLEYIQQTRH